MLTTRNALKAVVMAAMLWQVPNATAAYFCVPADVTEFDNRIHVRCVSPVVDGGSTIHYFALPTGGSEENARRAGRFLAVAMAAMALNKPVLMHFAAGDLSGGGYGCGHSDCRRPYGFAVQM